MDLYNVFGVINTIFILFSLLGVFSQLRTIWLRKQQASTQHSPAELLSLNQFSVSFLAYFSFFIYLSFAIIWHSHMQDNTKKLE